MKKRFAFLLLFMVVCAFVSAQQKFALVIGNGAYTGLSPLKNPVNDANDVEAALKSLGFTVDKVLNGNLNQIENSITQFKDRLSKNTNTYGFFFYAGHGVQSGGLNYLIPVGANIPSENYLRERAVSVQAMLGDLNDAGNALNVVVLDACRDNPFSWARSGNRGLTIVSNQPADSIIVYATSAGATASDGTGKNGLFTEQLLKHLKTPGLDIKEVFDLTGDSVSRASDRKQIPAIYSQYFKKAYFGALPAAATPAATAAEAIEMQARREMVQAEERAAGKHIHDINTMLKRNVSNTSSVTNQWLVQKLPANQQNSSNCTHSNLFTRESQSKDYGIVLGVRSCLCNPFIVKPQFTIPLIDDHFLREHGLINKNIYIKSISVTAYGLSFNCDLYLNLLDEKNENKKLHLGKLNFDGWKSLKWTNPNNRNLSFSENVRFDGFIIEPVAKTGDFVTYFGEIIIEY